MNLPALWRRKGAAPGALLILVLLLWSASNAAAETAASQQTLRPPAVPLVTHDPYFSIWSPADKLTDADTMHWTGKPHRLTSLVRIDGKGFRIMGKSPAEVPALPQTGLEVIPTRTIYTFEGEGVRLTLTFLTPALPDDLEVLSRPVTYLTWEARATDGHEHKVGFDLDAWGEIAVNQPAQEVRHTTDTSDPDLRVLKIGSNEQAMLRQKGDDLRIDWGYFYVAVPSFQQPSYCHARLDNTNKAPLDYRSPGPASQVLTHVSFDLRDEQVGAKPVSRWLMLAYDDEFSIKYFRQNLRPYWRRNGDDASALLKKAAADYERLKVRCEQFDAELMAALRKTGGQKYAQLCALAYRQTFAGNKIVADANGQPLMFPKENFSNGCIGTVDVLFPQAPFFLCFSPALTKAMLVPILDYASSPRWPYAYAPHDLGTYPHATGQVYGMNGKDGDRMPVEESGNMLILLAALAQQQGDAALAKKYWPMLTHWADYLVKEGLDPENQLCSADMFGHLPHAANLSLKAIIAIGGYARLCDQVGQPDQARKYLSIARDYTARWQQLAGDNGHTRLAYHQPGSWGMKHNLIWDRVLGLKLFPDSLADAEIAWYLKVQKPYGLPVDNRTDTSLIDWALWSIAPARNEAAFEALLEPIWRYANETPSRVPLSDWLVTTSAAQKGFQARPVVGGMFIKLLADAPAWRKWAGRGADTHGPWAAIPIGGATTAVVPTAQTVPAKWRYTLETPAEDWVKPGFDDHGWQVGQGGFGTKGTPGAIIGTEWKTTSIWLRREFTLPERPLKEPRLLVNYDEDPEIYLNGVLAARLTGWNGQYDEVDIASAALATLKPGRNVLAVRARQTYGGQSIDVGIVAEGAASGQTPAAGRESASSKLPGLRKLLDTPLRDTSICRGPDGNWYLTGTVEPFWAYNQGIQVWQSPDLTNWTALGFVWKYGGSPWHQPYLEKKKPLWAPEIHYLKGTFWLTYSLPGWDGTGKTSGCGLLRSTSGKAEGPYQDMHPQGRLGDEIDASLFQDDDGAVYFLWHSGKIARMKPDLSDLAEPYRWLKTTTTDPNPKHHSGLCAGIFGKESFDHVGYEGMFLFKREGRYYLACAENFEGRYSCSVAIATNLFGPYGERYEAIPHGGHNTFFRDAAGQWWSTYFGSDAKAPWRERSGVLPVEFSPQGRLQPLHADSARTFYVDAERGEDQHDGLKPETAWRSLAQVNHAPLAPGDRVLFRRGQTWRGQLVPQSGNASGVITYGAFGEGPKPVLLGSAAADKPEDWQPNGKGFWATVPLRFETIGVHADLQPRNWSLHQEGGAACALTPEEHSDGVVLRLACRSPGTRANHLQLSIPGLTVQAGDYYLFTFQAQATRPFTPASVSLMKSGPPWTSYAVAETALPVMGTNWTEYSIRFLARQSATDARLTLFLGGALPADATLLLRSGRLLKVQPNQAIPLSVDVGNIIFDHGRATGVKKWSQAELLRDGDYFYDARSWQVKLRSETNPAKRYQSIELALRRHIIDQSSRAYVTYENLGLRYGAAHGIGGSSTAHITVRGCDISYIGGGHQLTRPDGKPVRFGNGIEFWSDAHDCLVEDCRLWEIYDAALTNQGDGTNVQERITYRGNVIWNSEYSFEFWNRGPASRTRDIVFVHNICVDAGLGWGHRQRPDPNGHHLMFYANTAATTNVVVRCNIFCNATDSLLRLHGPDWTAALVMDQNCWFQPRGPWLLWGQQSVGAEAFGSFMHPRGFDRHSVLTEPRFINAAQRDYRLVPESPARAVIGQGS